MQNKKEGFDYEALKKRPWSNFARAKIYSAKGGAFAPLLKGFLEAALQAELDEHWDQEDPEQTTAKMATQLNYSR